MTSLRSLCATSIIVAALFAPVPASAATGAVTGPVDYRVLMDSTRGEAIVLVSLTIPGATKLPATVRIPVPPGMTVQWAGELSGTDPSADIERPHELKRGMGGEYAEFRIEKSRQAQIDVGGMRIPPGAAVTAQFAFVQTVPTERSVFSVRVPRGAYDVGIDPLPVGEPAGSAAGEAIYTLPSKQLKPGETARVSVSYRVRPQQRIAPDRPDRDWTLLLLVGLGAVVTSLALLYTVRRSTSPSNAKPRKGRRREIRLMGRDAADHGRRAH